MAGRFTFPRSRRLSGRLAFSRVFEGRVRASRGPLTVYAAANGLSHARLGLSVSRRVGTAVVRNRIKRLLREAYRLSQSEIPPGADYVVVVRPHKPLDLTAYQSMVVELTKKLADRLQKGEAS